MLRFICYLIFSLFSLSAFASEQLIIEPDAGRAPLLNAMTHAQSEIDMVMYGLTDPQFIQALVQAKNTGKNVRVLLEAVPYKNEDENTAAISEFNTKQISWQKANPEFKLTHQKTFLIDHYTAIVMTFNLTRSSFKNERNFALIINDPLEVKEIEQVFNADWQRKNFHTTHPSLIWSPDNSREKLLDFIRSAKSTVKIYAQDISDYQTIGVLAKLARAGKKVQLLMSNTSKNNSKKIDYLRKAGVLVEISKKYIIHAKIIIIDHEKAMLGSMNLTQPSINNNRELSIISHDSKVINELDKTFDNDWGGLGKFSYRGYHHRHFHLSRRFWRKMERMLG